MLIVVFLLLHCQFIYTAVSKTGVPRANHTAFYDYPDYEQFKPEPDRGSDYDLFKPEPIKKFPQLVTLPDIPREASFPTRGDARERQRFSSYGNDIGRRNGIVMGNPRMRYRPTVPRNSAFTQQQQQNIYGSPMGYSYAGYIERQARRFPIMMYTLVQCVPCQRAKHLLAESYSDVAAHFLELVGDEDWQRQLQVDLQQMTGQVTFPYIFICGTHIGGSSDLFGLHQSGQLRTILNNCVGRSKQ